MTTDKRLIEHYIPIKAISAEASREKSIRHGHISTLHLWWARRPLVAARAAVFAALVAADAQPQIIDLETKQPMTITKFMVELCKWQVSDDVLEEARRLIREAYPDQPPKVLDMFAGGGSIPLEALRLGAEAYALDLNPVAHIIELATLVYPQKYGKALAEDVKKWGNWVLERVRAEVGDLYPLIPDPEHTEERERFFKSMPKQIPMFPSDEPEQLSFDDTTPQPPTPSPSQGRRGESDSDAVTSQPPDPSRSQGRRGRIKPERLVIPAALQEKMIAVARQFRKAPTATEHILWEALRNKQVGGFRFRRQQPIGPFVVDFYCAEAALVIEVDGPIHESQREADAARQSLIEVLGIRFLRFRSDQVENDLAGVLKEIRAAVTPQPPAPSPSRGRRGEGDSDADSHFSSDSDPDSSDTDVDFSDLDPDSPDLDPDSPFSSEKEKGDGGMRSFLQPVAYLWTRTVTCPNPACRAAVPLVRQTWLKKKKGDNVALAMLPHPTQNRMRFEVRRATDPADFGFDPAGFSQRGSSLCGRCGTTVTTPYIKQEGKAGRMGVQMMATVCVRAGGQGKVYLSPDEIDLPLPDEEAIRARIEALTAETGITPPEEPLPEKLTGGMCTLYGLDQFYKLFTPRQLLTLLTFVKGVRGAHAAMIEVGLEDEYAKAVTTYLGLALDKMTDRNSSLCRWDLSFSGLASTFSRQALPMVWDFVEANPLADGAGSLLISVSDIHAIISNLPSGMASNVDRGSATQQPFNNQTLDAVITDPPYYDNISYADLSDYFYVWLKRSLGFLYPEHLSADITPKKREAIAASYRHQDNKDQARTFYESMMAQAFGEANRVLKPDGFLVTVYAHKTTAGWSTLIDAMRKAGFAITEAWPLDTELAGRAIAQDTAALASSFFLVARKRSAPILRYDYSTFDGGHVFGDVGDYLHEVQPEMRTIIRERVRFFLAQGITGADLNIAAVGAGLAPFTRYARVELPNGAELSAAAYLDEAQAEVVRVLLGEAAQTDPVTQYYIMGRSYYGEAWVEFDEANTLARATGIELDSGAHALTKGKTSLIEKKGAKVRLRDYSERGESSSLGLPSGERASAPLIDVLHRLLWLVEHDHSGISDLLAEARFDKYLLRLSAQTLSGRALAGEPTPGAVRDERTPEQRAIDSLLAGWRRIIDEGKML